MSALDSDILLIGGIYFIVGGSGVFLLVVFKCVCGNVQMCSGVVVLVELVGVLIVSILEGGSGTTLGLLAAFLNMDDIFKVFCNCGCKGEHFISFGFTECSNKVLGRNGHYLWFT